MKGWLRRRVEELLLGNCIRRLTGDLPGPKVPACAPRRRFAKGLSIHSGQAKGEYSLFLPLSVYGAPGGLRQDPSRAA